MFSVNHPDNQKPRLIFRFCWNRKQHRLISKALGLNEIDAMFRAITLALRSVEFEGGHGVKTIP
jgi:hypothetical protein